MIAQPKQLLLTAIACVLSAAAWFYGTGLHPHWILTWLAPLPILLIAPRVSRMLVFFAAFFAFVAGALNCWTYLNSIVPLWLLLMSVLVPALVFALIVLLHRRFLVRGQLLRAAFALPILWTALEYLIEFHSVNSTWGNLGYTQMNLLPLIQVASLTGIWAISFAVLLFAGTVSALAAASGNKVRLAVIVAAFYIVVFGYGTYRLSRTPAAPMIRAALIGDDAPPQMPSGQQTVARVQAYADRIPAVAAQGAQVIVLPEEIGQIQGSDLDRADAILEQSARQNRVTIAAGFRNLPNRNQVRLYAPDGKLQETYEKHHLLPPFESNLLRGTKRALVEHPSGKWGIEICKDMDFPLLSRQYNSEGAGLMLVPAWDFVVDGWLHSRMAILRGVESGFSIARSAKLGELTASDSRGRVLAQQSSTVQSGSATAPFSVLMASIPVWHQPTFYARTGDWFAWIDLILAALLLASATRKQGTLAARNSTGAKAATAEVNVNAGR